MDDMGERTLNDASPLPLSVQAELAKARSTEDRMRRLERELTDRENDLAELRGGTIAEWAAMKVSLHEAEADLDAAQEQVATLRSKLAAVEHHNAKLQLWHANASDRADAAERARDAALVGVVAPASCSCPKLPHTHRFDHRSCTGAGHRGRLVEDQAARIAALEHEVACIGAFAVEATALLRRSEHPGADAVEQLLTLTVAKIQRGPA